MTRNEGFWLLFISWWSLFSLGSAGLAVSGHFVFGLVVALLLLSTLLTFWLGWRLRVIKLPSAHREMFFLLLLIAIGGGLYAHPAERWLMFGDAYIYPNTAVLLAKTGGLTYQYTPLDNLSAEAKRNFYLPADEQFGGYYTVKAYQGILFGAYYVMDEATNTIIASRQPVVYALLATAGMMLGWHAMLYLPALFGLAGLIAVYFAGKQFFNAKAGAWAALLLAFSFPQLYFARNTYAEIFTQFFVWSTFYLWGRYCSYRERASLLGGMLTAGIAFAAHIDAIVLLPIAWLFLILTWQQHYRGDALIGAVGLGAAIVYDGLTVNRPYVQATWELLSVGQLNLFERLPYWPWIFLVLFLGASFAMLAWWQHHIRVPHLPNAGTRWIVAIVLIGITAYALYIRPHYPSFTIVNGQYIRLYDEELVFRVMQYLSPFLLWTAVLGLVQIFWNSNKWDTTLLGLSILGLSLLFFWKYTTAHVYPVALRRYIPEVIPGLFLLSAYFLHNSSLMFQAKTLLIGAALLRVAFPYWGLTEFAGTEAFLQHLSTALPSQTVIVVEDTSPLTAKVAPALWALYDKEIVLSRGASSAMQQALCTWQAKGRESVVLSGESSNDHLALQYVTRMIGESREFPPIVWKFKITACPCPLSAGVCP